MRKNIELAYPGQVDRLSFPGARGKKAPGHCPKCGAALIRSPSVSVCENWWCESLPEIAAPAAPLEAWVGL
jgi:hypothetical protein